MLRMNCSVEWYLLGQKWLPTESRYSGVNVDDTILRYVGRRAAEISPNVQYRQLFSDCAAQGGRSIIGDRISSRFSEFTIVIWYRAVKVKSILKLTSRARRQSFNFGKYALSMPQRAWKMRTKNLVFIYFVNVRIRYVCSWIYMNF